LTDRRDDFDLPVELATVEAWRNERVPEEFPEGPYGAPERPDLSTARATRGAVSGSVGAGEAPGEGRPEQRPHLPFGYADRTFHEGMARAYPGEDPRPLIDERPDA